jgi:hypothetical protein
MATGRTSPVVLCERNSRSPAARSHRDSRDVRSMHVGWESECAHNDWKNIGKEKSNSADSGASFARLGPRRPVRWLNLPRRTVALTCLSCSHCRAARESARPREGPATTGPSGAPVTTGAAKRNPWKAKINPPRRGGSRPCSEEPNPSRGRRIRETKKRTAPECPRISKVG